MRLRWLAISFQFTPLREGRLLVLTGTLITRLFQFTLLREGRQNRRNGLYAADYFNSRPSARGDRNVGGSGQTGCRISIHAPPRGATVRVEAADGSLFISIHAPPRGATRAIRAILQSQDFNSRPSARGDARSPGKTRRVPLFQFTPLREGRPRDALHGAKPGQFQFTPLREGRRAQHRPVRTVLEISIHAPPRGATKSWTCWDGLTQFQFTPLREGRRLASS